MDALAGGSVLVGRPTGREELAFHLPAPVAVIAAAHVTDSGTPGKLAALVPVLVAFAPTGSTRHLCEQLDVDVLPASAVRTGTWPGNDRVCEVHGHVVLAGSTER